MSPAGGVGINLALQDAVATANLLADKLKAGPVSVADLEQVQARREWPHTPNPGNAGIHPPPCCDRTRIQGRQLASDFRPALSMVPSLAGTTGALHRHWTTARAYPISRGARLVWLGTLIVGEGAAFPWEADSSEGVREQAFPYRKTLRQRSSP